MQSLPYKPQEAVYYAASYTPNSKPLQITRGTVIEECGRRVQIRTAKGRRTVNPVYLLHAGYCAQCKRPAIDQEGQLVCPSCCQPAICEPPFDALLARWGFNNAWQRVLREGLSGCTLGEARQRARGLRGRRSHVPQQPESTHVLPDAPAKPDQPVEDTYALPSAPAEPEQPAEAESTYVLFGGPDALDGSEGADLLHEILDELPAEHAKWLRIMFGSCGFLKPQILDLIAPLCSVPLVLNALVQAALKQDRFRFAEITAIAVAVSRACFEEREPQSPGHSTWQPPVDDQQPDGADDLTHWLEGQFRKAA